MPGTEGKIPKDVFKVVIGLIFGIAIITAATRIIIRLRIQKRLYLDDGFLMFACICLTAATGVLYFGMSTVYMVEESSFEPTSAASISPSEESRLLQVIALIQRITWSYEALSWGTIFAVKFAFLSFFRPLVDRLPSTHRYWKTVVLLTALVAPISVFDNLIACPKLGIDARDTMLPEQIRPAQSFGDPNHGNIQDIVTDLLILLIPMSLLWRVQFKPRQKLGLAAFFSLNGCMIIVAIIRISGLHYHGQVDSPWDLLWQQVETCVAVTLLSLTAFRSIFVGGILKPAREKKRAVSPWWSSTPRVFKKREKFDSGDDLSLVHLTIPSATLTGMRTLIRNHEVEPSSYSPGEAPLQARSSQDEKSQSIYSNCDDQSMSV